MSLLRGGVNKRVLTQCTCKKCPYKYFLRQEDIKQYHKRDQWVFYDEAPDRHIVVILIDISWKCT